MSNTNFAVFSGNLGGNIERAATSGTNTTVANFSIAVNKHAPDGNEGFTTKTSWIPVKAFGKLAERMINKLVKGSNVVVTGEFEEERWNDANTGQKRSKLVLIANSFENLTTERNQDQQRPSSPQQNQNAPSRGQNNGQQGGHQSQQNGQGQQDSRPVGY